MLRTIPSSNQLSLVHVFWHDDYIKQLDIRYLAAENSPLRLLHLEKRKMHRFSSIRRTTRGMGSVTCQANTNKTVIITGTWFLWRIPGSCAARSSRDVAGANTGIGYETARALLKKGGYDIVMACRDNGKMQAAKTRLLAEAGQVPAQVDTMVLDLADLSSVRDFASRYLDSGRPINVLDNNAGLMAPPLLRTRDGFESQFGTNHLGHFLLTMLLLPRVAESGRAGAAARIVNVASTAHMFGHINFSDLNSERGYQEWIAYGQSKLANILFTYELARRLPNRCVGTAEHAALEQWQAAV